jgi:hypothetical protein
MRALQAWTEEWARAALRVLKPGSHLLAFGGTRTYGRLAAGIEDAGLEIRDCIALMYGCLTPDVEVLTGRGWTRGIDVQVGQHVANGTLGQKRSPSPRSSAHTGRITRVRCASFATMTPTSC